MHDKKTSGRKLRTLQLASHKRIKRGGAIQLVRLANELQRRGHEAVCVFNRKRDELNLPEFQALRKSGLEVVSFRFDASGEKKRFRRWIRERDFQILHAHRNQALVFACQALLGRRRPLIVASRGTIFPLKPFSWPRFCFRSNKVRCVTAVSAAVKDSLVSYGVKKHKIRVVYGSVDETEFHPAADGSALRAEWGGAADAPLVGNIAELEQKKGHDIFFHAAQRVRRSIPQCRFVCIGGGRPEKFNPLLEQLGLVDAVSFAGHRSDIPQTICAMDLVVSSATMGEGLTGAVREAMSCARPVVATDVAGNTEIVQDGLNGRLVPIRDSQALADAIIGLLRDPNLAQRLGQAARQTVLERFTNQQRGELMERIYFELLDGR